MKFKKGTRRTAKEYEHDLVRYWKSHQTFEKSIAQRPKEDAYVFYDGPPFITGNPHHGTLLSSVVKDVVPRYWTMKGKRVERVWGWDCHGLPAEVFTEKKLGIQDRRDIGTKISLEEYITTCRENMVQTGSLWEDTIDRIGRWVDFRGAYKTMDKDFMESVWWAFKQLYEAGKIYEGEKVLLYCTRDATPISKAEVAMDNSYKDVTEPSVYVKFPLSGRDNTYLLAWTTTPWTLPANTALAVNANETYAEVAVGNDVFIMAEARIPMVMTDEKHQPLLYKVLRTFPGRELVGKTYHPLFEDYGPTAHRVWAAEYVTLDDGTGVVHIAPAYGEEDYALSKEQGFPLVQLIDDSGFYNSGEWKGMYVWDANKPIAKTLQERGVVWKIDYITHSYPHCHRCGTKLMYRAHPSWFMDINGQRSEMLGQNANINWFPAHIKQGRFAKTVQSAPDWNLSRDRFWATAMPVWKGMDADGNERVKVIGSYGELKQLSGVELADYHRPWIDDVTFTIDGVTYHRIDKVIDCWFESGSMPFAQFHYPFENADKFEENFPGDFIVEYVGQVRAWFYYLHAVSVGLFGKNAFRNVIVTGTIAGNDGRKMSKSYGNYTDPNELMDRYSADALRFLLLGSPLLNGEDFALIDKDVSDVARKLGMVWNMYDFFTLYADTEQWEWDGRTDDPSPDLLNPLDRWIVSRTHQLIEEVDRHMGSYDIPSAVKPLLPFIDDASNWYIRRSRRRFWRNDDAADKQAAFRTLHYVLVQLAHVMAPFTPFMAEELFRKLTGEESVHLRIWPVAGHVNEMVLEQMAYVRHIIAEGLSQRAAAGVKVRQPLRKVEIMGAPAFTDTIDQEFIEILRDELNVKTVKFHTHMTTEEIRLDVAITPVLRREGLARDTVRHIQTARKQAGLTVGETILLSLSTTDEELRQTIEEYRDLIIAEALAVSMVFDKTLANETEVVVGLAPLTISLEAVAA